MPALERSLQQSVLHHLKKRRQQDPTLVYRKRHGTSFGVAGDPDIYGLWRGVHFEIELKRPGESPTALQRARLSEWGQAGASVVVIRSVAELETFFADLATQLRCKSNATDSA